MKRSRKKNEKVAKDEISIPFYTQERWNNWIEQAKASGFKIEQASQGPSKASAIFVNMVDDVVLACLKVVNKFEKNIFTEQEALKEIQKIASIVSKKIPPINEDIDLMLESVQNSLMSVFAACEFYIKRDYSKEASVERMVKQAAIAEQNQKIEEAFKLMGKAGALVLSGAKIDEKLFEEIQDSNIAVAEWLDGIDSIAAAMVGDTSWRDDEGDYSEEDDPL
ncbi:MAG: DUF2150 family protein [Methanocellales archaeon]